MPPSAGYISVFDLIGQRCHDPVLPFQELRPGQVLARNGVVGDERTVAGQVLNEGLELNEHFLL